MKQKTEDFDSDSDMSDMTPKGFGKPKVYRPASKVIDYDQINL